VLQQIVVFTEEGMLLISKNDQRDSKGKMPFIRTEGLPVSPHTTKEV
jgi:hypothetical protein